jgi:hypothetical protein
MTWVDRASTFLIDQVAPRLLALTKPGPRPSLEELRREALRELRAPQTRPLEVLRIDPDRLRPSAAPARRSSRSRPSRSRTSSRVTL